MVVSLFCFSGIYLALSSLGAATLLKRKPLSPRVAVAGWMLGAALPILLISIVVIVSSVGSYTGICYGFTDGSWPCSMPKYIQEELFWTGFIAVIPLTLAEFWHLLIWGLFYFLGRRPATPTAG